jgi:hypothetical protein
MTRGSEVTDSGWPLYRPLSSEALHMMDAKLRREILATFPDIRFPDRR